MMLVNFLCIKQKLYQWVCNRNIESGGNKISNESRLVHILHDDIKNLCSSTNSEKSWTICKCNISITEFYLDQLHHESHLIFNKKKTFLQTLTTNFIHHISSINRTGAWSKFQLKGMVLIGRRALYQGIYIIHKLLICTDSALVQAFYYW